MMPAVKLSTLAADAWSYIRYRNALSLMRSNYPGMASQYEPLAFSAWRESPLNSRYTLRDLLRFTFRPARIGSGQ